MAVLFYCMELLGGRSALTVLVAAGEENGTVRLQTDSVIVAGGDGNDICPVGNFALLVMIPAGCHNGAVRLQTDGMAGAAGNGNDIGPLGTLH